MFTCKRENLNPQVATYMILQWAQQKEGANHIWERVNALWFCEVLLREMEETPLPVNSCLLVADQSHYSHGSLFILASGSGLR